MPWLRKRGEAAPPRGQRGSCRVTGQEPLECRAERNEEEAGDVLAGLGCSVLGGGHKKKAIQINNILSFFMVTKV